MKPVTGALLTLAGFFATMTASAKEPEVILAVLAHPDDETLFGGALTHYTNKADIHVIYVADGRYGVREHAGIPPGEELVAVRKEEARCAAEARGFKEPIFLDYTDQLVGKGTPSGKVARLDEAAKKVDAEISRLNPDIVVTFAPGGATGHPDHRLVGDLTTQVMLSRDPASMKLFQAGWPQSQAAALQQAGVYLTPFRDDVFDVAIKFSGEDEEKEFAALRCYKSQYTDEEMEGFIAVEKADETNTRWFREIPLKGKPRDKF